MIYSILLYNHILIYIWIQVVILLCTEMNITAPDKRGYQEKNFISPRNIVCGTY